MRTEILNVFGYTLLTFDLFEKAFEKAMQKPVKHLITLKEKGLKRLKAKQRVVLPPLNPKISVIYGFQG